jgi:hypothetical protein
MTKDHSRCPFCLGSGYSTDVHENEYILQLLHSFMIDIKTDKNKDQLIDSYACKLTSFMNGRMVGKLEKKRNTKERR